MIENGPDDNSMEWAVGQFIDQCPFTHTDLEVMVFGGSRKNKTFGELSDLDLTTVMKSMNTKVVDLAPMLELCSQMRDKCSMIHRTSNITPVIISTVALEEAQIEMARMLHPEKMILPIHWLYYPSLEYMAINEPKEIACGLLAGTPMMGDSKGCITKIEEMTPDPNSPIKGLGNLVDSLRILAANNPVDGERPRVPVDFLKKNASHVLGYFWKWKIVKPYTDRETGVARVDWSEIQRVGEEIAPELMEDYQRVNSARHKGARVHINEVVNLYIETFDRLATI